MVINFVLDYLQFKNLIVKNDLLKQDQNKSNNQLNKQLNNSLNKQQIK